MPLRVMAVHRRMGQLAALSLGLVSLALLLLFTSAQPAWAADKVVGNGSAGSCTEAELVTKLAGGGNITFACSNSPNPIILSVPITITADTTIDGTNGGHPVTISGGNITRVFQVDPGATVTINNLTIRDAYSNTGDGGAIRNGGTLVITNSRFYSNTTSVDWSGGAILSYGTLTITGSDFAYNRAANAGAVRVNGVATIQGTFEHNQTTHPTNGWGGAIMVWDSAAATVTASSFVSNTARLGGAIRVVANARLTLNGSLLTDNRAEGGTGGALDSLGTVFISASQIVTNSAGVHGGGLHSGTTGELTIDQSIIAGNRVRFAIADFPLLQTQGGGIRSQGNLTITNSLISGNSLSVGQNGSAGGGLHHETGRLTLTNVTFTGNRAIHGGGANVGSGTATLTGLTVYSNQAESGQGGGLRIQSGTVTVSGSQFYQNYAYFGGGGVSVGGMVTISQSSLTRNNAYTSGGGLSSYGTTTVLTSTIAGNIAAGGGTGEGGGMVINNGTLTLVNSTVSGNFANQDGGGISNRAGLVTSRALIVGNWAQAGDEVETANGGGGIYNRGTAFINETTLDGNWTTTLDGGGFYNDRGTANFSRVTFSHNTADEDGGGLTNVRGTVSLLNVTFSGNNASGWGGGLLSDHGLTDARYVTFSGNSATAGGGVFNLTVFPTATLMLESSLFADNPGANCATFAGSLDVISNGGNLSDDGSFVNDPTGFCPVFGGDDQSNVDPHLGPLAPNGGFTPTHLPLPGSPAIDAITTGVHGCGTSVPVDQRGNGRPVNGDSDPAIKCDIGAVEVSTPGQLSPWLWLPLAQR